jgi:hypothetical protein
MIVKLLLQLMLGAVVYIALCLMLKVDSFQYVLNIMRNRKKEN